MFIRMPKLMLDESDGAGGAAASEDKEDKTVTPENWDSYLSSLPEDQRSIVEKLYTDKNQTLLNSVKETRKERDDFAKQLREAAKKLDKGSEAETQFTEQVALLEEANRKADFYEAAPSQECKNPRAAFLIAKAGNHFDKNGLPDWKAIKEEVPEFFGTVAKDNKAKGKGGAGAGTAGQAKSTSVNDFIRQQAGINTISSD